MYIGKMVRGSNRGVASIIVTLVIMFVISLIVIGLAGVSRNEQRQSLDQQLSTQAFYAAESGVEDARAVLRQNLATGEPLVNKDNCKENNPGGEYPSAPVELQSGSGISYTCLKVDVAPEDAQYSAVGEEPIVVPIKTATPLTSLQITWQPSTPPASGSTPAACPSTTTGVFSPTDTWNCLYGVLRTDLVPTGGTLTRAGLQSNTLTGFFVPNRVSSPGTLAYGGNANRPNVAAANCTSSSYGTCRMTITGLSGTDYTLRINSIYHQSDVTVSAYSGGTQLVATGAQAVIDVTGKAQDVLRRIQVRVPLTNGTPGKTPTYAIQSRDGICKRFRITNDYFNIQGIIDEDNNTPTNPMCTNRTVGTAPPGA